VATLRRILLFLLLFFVLVIAVVFAALNPGTIKVDLGLFEAQVQKPLAFAIAFGAGWLFGMLCLAFVMTRMAVERRRLRKALRLAEAEVHTLRSLPPAHAD
jgi:uncharacterized membrane protein YciS (DUF1049 family)